MSPIRTGRQAIAECPPRKADIGLAGVE